MLLVPYHNITPYHLKVNRMLRLSQKNPIWANVKLKNTGLTVRSVGCTLTSINMGLLKFNPKSEIRPNDIARLLKFTDVNHPKGEGLIIWGDNEEQFKQLGIQFIGRYYGDSEDDIETIDKMAEDDDHFVIIEVLRKDGGNHWMFCHGTALTWRGFGLACDDPINGAILWKTVGWGAPYVRMTGNAVFKKI